MNLIDKLVNKYKIVALIGMAKNAGKTTLLNYMIDEAYWSEIVIGVTSIGWDGETVDAVTKTPKPPIEVFKGTIVATAKKLIDNKSYRCEILEITNYETAVGPIIIIRMLEGAKVQLIGPRSNDGLKYVSEKMQAYGAEIVFIDGALDRISSASPAVADAVLLSTGASLSRDVNEVVNLTNYRVNLLGLKEVEECKDIFIKMRKRNKVCVVDNNASVEVLGVKTGINAGDIIKNHIKKDSKYIFFPGALTFKTAKDILDYSEGNITVVISDGSKIFIDKDQFYILKRKGLNVAVIDTINLIGISVNPISPKGYYYDGKIFLDKLRQKIKNVDIFNIYDL